MDIRLDERELATALSMVLDRVRRGERFIVERDGAELAVLSPPDRYDTARPTGRELAGSIGDLTMPGDGFGGEIESARRGLLPVEAPAWPE